MNTGKLNFKVSVILTLYNSRKFYKRALESVFNQSFENIETVIVDDGSKDDTYAELLPDIIENQKIKYLYHSNRGQALSLNSGIAVSSGEYITFLDADDEYKPDHILRRIQYFQNNTETDLIRTGAELIGSDEDMYIPDANDSSRLIHVKDCVMLGTLFGKRNVFTELDGFRNIYSHDSDFFNRAAAKYKTAYLESDTYIYYRNNPDSVLSKLKKSMNER
ncbi:MAG TPA: glycosyltransferase family 2 protein [Ignavibacteria bacterium]|nr:glycosyl transferase [Bacteroidota bacterium]HRI83986.1 glycosyltransferase family 2 protein [Ignavibacteria bacterium]HRJ99183.1 glycosyltransferase family 2 protein [Ignavibacteria bacterium]